MEALLNKFEAAKEKLLQWPFEYKCYLTGALLWLLVAVVNSQFSLPAIIVINSIYLPFTCFSIGLISWLYQPIKNFYSQYKTQTKWLLGLLSFFIFNIGYGWAKHDIHRFTGLLPDTFSSALIWLPLFRIAEIYIAIFLLIFAIVYVLGLISLTTGAAFTYIPRLLGGGGLAIFIGIASDLILLDNNRRAVLAISDYYAFSRCDVRQGERVRYLKNNKISVAYLENGKWNFKKTEDCKEKT